MVTYVAGEAAVTSSTQLTIARPLGVVEGDLLLAFVIDRSNRAVTPPSGWTQLHYEDGGTIASITTFYKWAGSGEPADYSFTRAASTDWGGTVVAYRNVDTVTPIDTDLADYLGFDTSSGIPSVTTSVDGCMIVGAVMAYGSTTFGSPDDGSTVRVLQPSTMPSFLACDRVQASSGSTGGAVVSTSSAAHNFGAAVALAPGNSAPDAPVLELPVDGAAVDVGNVQRFSWTFSDPDPGDTQSAYELRYDSPGVTPGWVSVSGGAAAYHDMPAGTFVDGVTYEWQVRTTDNNGNVGPWSASRFFDAISAPATPSLTVPVDGATIASSTLDVEWTADAQDAYQVRVVADDGAGNPDTSTVPYDSGTVVSTTRVAYGVPFPASGVSRHVQVRVRDGGLWSPWESHAVSVSYTAPPAPTLEATAIVEPVDGLDMPVVLLEVTNPAPVGDEPAVVSNELHVRVAAGGRADGQRTVGDDGLHIADVGNGGSYVDRAVAHGVAYEYRVRAVGDNGVGAWSAWV